MSCKEITNNIKSYIHSLGFDACGICKAKPVDEINSQALESWIANGYHADMDYMARNGDKRLDPSLLVPEAKSIIVLALNYYPKKFQQKDNPQFAYYAYGKDYHEVIKNKLKAVYEYCQSLDGRVAGRYFCDTAPLVERYWAAKAGLGWIGKNSLLIIPKKGTYFFLGAIVLNIELEYDTLKDKRMPDCVNCTKCIDACPTGAIVEPRIVDSGKCLSYQTIENKGEIPVSLIPDMNNRVYGCDICQQVCPWNKFSTATEVEEFTPSPDFLSLTTAALENMDETQYQRIFKGSAVKRTKLSGLKRNVAAVKKSKK